MTKQLLAVFAFPLACLVWGTSAATPATPAITQSDAVLLDTLSNMMRRLSVRPGDNAAGLSGTAPQIMRDGQGGWIIDLGADFLEPYAQEQIPGELDERLQAMRLALLLDQEQSGTDRNIAFRFSGASLEEMFAEPRTAVRQAPREGGVDVFVSASHGYYYHHGFNDWRLQRPLSNGMVEDLVTPLVAAEVVRQLALNGRTSMLSRSTVETAHPLSGQSWWQMAARYHAQALHPQHPELWESYDDRGSPLREYNDDIRTRPLLANFHGARTLVHLHTNAAGSPDARGMMAFVQPSEQSDRQEDRRLGHVLLCSIRAALQATPAYASYRVRVQPLEGNYGENRLAAAPSVLIEMGFHTNKDDAQALQDPLFQRAFAAGLAAGHAAFLAGSGADGGTVCQ